MNCRMLQRHVDAYIDGEVDPTAQIEFERHLEDCQDCAERLTFERAFKAQVREHLGSVRAPAGLEERLRASIAQADSSAESAPGGWQIRWMPLRPRYAIPLGVAAAVIMGLFVSAVPGLDAIRGAVTMASMSGRTAEEVVRVHSEDLPADVQGNEPQQVTDYFRNKLAFRVQPVRFGRDVALVGARLSNVRDRRAAALYYNVGGRRVTVMVCDQPDDLGAGAVRTRLFGRELFYRQVHGYTVPMRKQDGITYAFTGDLDRRALLQLAAQARVHY